jgi:alanyl-tRNA synthetase
MNSQLLYQQDPTLLRFDTTVVEVLTLPDGRTGAILDRSYFYPTGGGQEHDTGNLGTARVVDVFMDEQTARLVHVVQEEVDVGAVVGHIDAERRLRHMQSHTAQHLLTQCVLRQAGFETVSANINGYSPSTLDIVASNISSTDLEAAELQANRVIYENRVVKTYFVSPEELHAIPLRRPPKVSENIRIVEIDGYDYSPCGGTHVLNTGSIGLVKVLKAERQNDKTRIHFVAGLQAFELFRHMYASLTGMSAQMSTGWQELPGVVSKLIEQQAALQKELKALQHASLISEARELAARAQQAAGVRLVRAGFEDRPISELRSIAEQLKQVPDLVACLASYDGQKLSLIVTCGEASGRDARLLLSQQLTKVGGRGGGDARLAQGGGVATADEFSSFLQEACLD